MDHLQALSEAVGGFYLAPILLDHRSGRRLVFAGQGLQERSLHHPVESCQLGQVLRELVVLHASPVFELVEADDGVITLVQQLGSVDCLSRSLVAPALGFDYWGRDE